MRLSLATKIILLFTIVVAVFMGVSFYQLSHLQRQTQSLFEINLGYTPLIRIITQIDNTEKNLLASINRATELETPQVRVVLRRLVTEYYPRLFREHVKEGLAHCEKMRMFALDEKRAAFYETTRKKLNKLLEHHEAYQEKIGLFFDDLLSENLQAAQKSKLQADRLERELAKEIKKLSMNIDDQLSRRVRNLERQNDQAGWAAIALMASAFFIAVLLAILSAFALKPLRRLSEAAKRIGKGNYEQAVEIQSKDELGQLATEFEKMRRSLIERDSALKEQAKKLERSNVDLSTLKIHYESILNNLSLPVMVADYQLHLQTVNPAAVKLWGERLWGMIGKPISSLPLESGDLGDVLDIHRVLNKKVTIVQEAIRVLAESGERRRVTFTALPFLEKETVKGLLLLGEDVTDKQQMKNALFHAERMAAIGRMSAKINHEVRNPLSSISLNAEMLEEELQEGKSELTDAKELLARIINEVDRLKGITEEYLQLARTPAQSVRQMDVNRVIANVVDLTRMLLEQAGVECCLMLSERSILIEADENRIIQVVHNLINNAVEAMEEHGGVLEISTSVDEHECVIEISDNGDGVPLELQEKIFEQFFTTKEEKGSGLGLALARQFIEELSGSLTLDETKDVGARFIVRLPLASEQGESAEGDSSDLLD